jgi:phasin family protein
MAKPAAAAPVIAEPIPVASNPVSAKASVVPAPAKKTAAAAVTKKAKPLVKPATVKKTAVIAKPIVPVAQKATIFKIAPAASSPVLKGTITMSANPTSAIPTSTKAVTEKVQSMFTEMNDRAKTAMEKSAKVGEEITEFTKGNVEAFVASAKTAAKGAETLGQEAAEYGKKSFESASTAMKSMATVKSPTELFQIQSEFAKASFDGAVSEVSKFTEAWMKLAGDIFQPLSSRYALAAEKIKAAAL